MYSLIWLIGGCAAGQGKVFVHPSLNTVYIKIREAVVRFRGLLVNWAEKVMKRFCTQLIFGFSEGWKWT